MKASLILAFICLASVLTYGQENLIRWNEAKPLQWEDFLGSVKDTSQFDAESFAEVRYNYTIYNLKDFSFEVTASFNKSSSWHRKEYQNEDLLKHEQGHFDIAELFARRIKETFAHFRFSENYTMQIAAIFDEQKEKYHLMQHLYDEETNHSLDKKNQKQWEIYIHDELAGTAQPAQAIVKSTAVKK